MIARVELLATLFVGLAVLAQPVAAELPPEEVGQVMTLPEAVGEHWVWVPDQVLRHSALFDDDAFCDLNNRFALLRAERRKLGEPT